MNLSPNLPDVFGRRSSAARKIDEVKIVERARWNRRADIVG